MAVLALRDVTDHRAGGWKAARLAAAASAALAVPDGFVLTGAVTTAAIAEGLADLVGDGPVMVRSSALPEDGTVPGTAGRYLSVPAQRTVTDVGEAVARVIDHAISVDGHPCPVLVQCRIDAHASGVAVGGPTQPLLVEAGPGPGAVVGGDMTPERWWHDGNRWDGEGVLLEATHLDAISVLVDVAAELLDDDVDVEWALDRDGVLWCVQLRPLTATVPDSRTGGDHPASDHDTVVLAAGLGASAGVATGVARILTDPTALAEFEPGDILVATTTTPTWVPLMRIAGGFVTDTGGLTCHAAIVARELGVPCVVDCGDATTTLVAGRRITVDGNRGIVQAAS